MENQHKNDQQENQHDHNHKDNYKNQRHIEETNRENEEIEREFPTEEYIEDGAVQFPSEREDSTEELDTHDQTRMTTETGTDQSDADYNGFSEEDRYSPEEAGEAGGFTTIENDAALEERIANDQTRQGGGVNVKATNEPDGRPNKDGEEAENV